jgi:hypothetical protein
MKQYQQTVGGRELCAAVRGSDVSLLETLLSSKASMDPALVEGVQGRTSCLVDALCAAVTNRAMVKVLLAAPDYWGHVTPSALADVVRRVACERFKYEHLASEEGLWVLLDLLRKAGADIDVGGGALLMADIGRHNISAVE